MTPLTLTVPGRPGQFCAAHVMEQVVLLSALLEPAAAVSVPPVIFFRRGGDGLNKSLS